MSARSTFLPRSASLSRRKPIRVWCICMRAGQPPSPGACSQHFVMRSRRVRSSGADSANRGAGATRSSSCACSWAARPGVGERERLHPAVGRCGVALDEAAGLEPVGQPRDVRRIAAQRLGQRAHRQGAVGAEHRQRLHLSRVQIEVPSGLHEGIAERRAWRRVIAAQVSSASSTFRVDMPPGYSSRLDLSIIEQ